MGKHALIFNGVVADVVGSPFEVASGMMWVDITALDPPPEPEWTYVDGAFAPPVRPVPPAPTADQIRQALTSAVQRHLDTTAQQRGLDADLLDGQHASAFAKSDGSSGIGMCLQISFSREENSAQYYSVGTNYTPDPPYSGTWKCVQVAMTSYIGKTAAWPATTNENDVTWYVSHAMLQRVS